MAVILPFLVALGLFAFLVTLARWFVYIHGLDLNLISLEESRYYEQYVSTSIAIH